MNTHGGYLCPREEFLDCEFSLFLFEGIHVHVRVERHRDDGGEQPRYGDDWRGGVDRYGLEIGERRRCGCC